MLQKFVHILIPLIILPLPGYAQNLVMPGDFASIAVTDFNGDGNPDVLFTGNSVSGNSGIAVNKGNGEFSLTTLPVPGNGTSTGWTDLNNDGFEDFFIFGSGKAANALYINDKKGSFLYSGQFNYYHFLDPDVTVIDIENDGDADLFITAWDVNQSRRFTDLFLNDGNGVFIPGHTDLIQKGFGSSAWADVNSDGLADLLLNGDGDNYGDGGSFDIYRLYLNNGDGSFSPGQVFQNYRQISVGDGSRFADWNNDGYSDIILTGWSSSENRQVCCIFLNDGNAFFTRSVESDLIPGVSESSIEVADIDNDNRIDLLLTGYSGNYDKRISMLYYNQSEILNTAPQPPSGLITQIENNNIIFSWEPGSDGETPQNSMSYNIGIRLVTDNRWLTSPDAITEGPQNGFRKITGMGNVFLNHSWKISGLPEGKYSWTVQSIDASYTGSVFPTEMVFCIKDTARLVKLLNEAKSMLLNAVPGENPGQYSQSAINNLQDTINIVEPLINDIGIESREIEIPLSAAILALRSSKIGVDISTLSELILTGAEEKTNAVIGDEPGNYPESAVLSLQDAVNYSIYIRDKAEQIGSVSEIPGLTDSVVFAENFLETSLELFRSQAVVISYDSLQAEIDKATILHDSSGIASCNIQNRHESKRQLAIAIENAIDSLNEISTSQAEIDQAVINLRNAENAFLATVITLNYKYLKALIDSATTIYDTALSSDYPSGAKYKLMKAIYNANVVYKNSALCADLLVESINGMETVINDFINSRLNSITYNVSEVEIYPNPGDQKVFIDSIPFGSEIKIHNSIGGLVFIKRHSELKAVINTSGYPEGIYLVTITSGNGDFASRKIIIKRT